MNKDQLAQLREKIISDIMPLTLDTTQNGIEKFELLMRIIQSGNASSELYSRAYESAKSLEDNGERLNALLLLIDEIDFDMNKEQQNNSAIDKPQE